MRDTLSEVETLKVESAQAMALGDVLSRARAFKDRVLPAMETLRESVDAMEILCDREAWPYPTYGDILFSVK